MRLGLTQQLRAEQRQVQSPQMIQAMQVLQCPMAELRDQIDQELQENVFLEVRDDRDDADEGGRVAEAERSPETKERDEAAELWNELENLERRSDPGGIRPTRMSDDEADRRLDALYNAPDHAMSLP